MAIKDIFTMIKADRYTQDGREELIKAQEAVTEDVTYKPGDISRKTGLQKQPDGSWAPVKNAPGNKKPDGKSGSSEKHAKAMAHAEKVGVVSEVPTGWKKAEGVTTTPNGYVAITNGASLFPKEGEAKREIKFIKQEDFDKSASGSAPSAPKFESEQENAKYEEGLKGWDDVNPDRLPDIKKKVEQKIDYYKKYDPYAMLGKKTGLTAAQKSAVQQNMAQAKENLAFYTGQLEGINKKMGGGSNDSAPRILTGDCKVRIRKSK